MLCAEACRVKSGHGVAAISVLHCKLWSCSICEPRNAARLRADIKGGHPGKFLTFTARPDAMAGPAVQARRMKRWVRQVFEEWRRRHPGKEVEYLAVVEAHKSGWPHVHVAARAPSMDWRELRALWEAISGSYRVDIRAVRKQRGFARYLAKYLTKGSQVEGWGKRHWCSQGWLGEANGEPIADSFYAYSAEVVEGTLDALLDAYARVGWAVEERSGLSYAMVRAP